MTRATSQSMRCAPFRIGTASPTTGQRLRIALVVHDYHRRGGHARYTAELAARFRNEHDVTVFANSFDEPDARGITYCHVPAWRANALTTIVSFLLPATILARGPYDIIHAQGLCGLKQNVVTAHGCQPAWFAAADRVGGPSTWRKRVFRAVVSRLERLVMNPRAAGRFIAPSARLRDDLSACYGLGHCVRVIPHGVDTELFHPRNRLTWREPLRARLGYSASECVALYVGDLQKGLPAALRALARVADVQLLAVSASDPTTFAAQASAAGIAQRVRFVQATAHIERYYAAADLLLFPTCYDSFGLVIAEAMASGLPVITSRAAGAAEMIAHGASGWLTQDPWSAEQIAAGLAAFAADAGLRERVGSAARIAVEPYTWDRTAAATMAVYREVLAEARR